MTSRRRNQKICIPLYEGDSALIDEVCALIAQVHPGDPTSREVIAGTAMKMELKAWAKELRELAERRAAKDVA